MIKWWVANDYMQSMPAMQVFQTEQNRRPHFSDSDWDNVVAAMPRFAEAEGVATKRDHFMLSIG